MSKRHHPVNPQQWLDHIGELRGPTDMSMLQSAIDLYQDKGTSLLEKGLGISEILLSLGLDSETLATALVYPGLQAHEIHIDAISDRLGEGSVKMLQDLLQLQSLGKVQELQQRGGHQLENLRKMLLAMVTDVRAVLIVLAERLWLLHHAKNHDTAAQEKLAEETLAVYAPLANRLGVWQLKWEIEDFCLRYTRPDIYKMIAKGLASRRDERETYVKEAIDTLNKTLEHAGIKKFEVSGRVKHIYSIYKKMQRKHANLEEIYDMSALRVLVPTIAECYSVLSVLQNNWMQVHEEFDDYISLPKPNGYRSIHTVLIGPENHYIEVQIRTFKMHQESELGVAAHWRYKEGVLQASSYEAKIALLRQVIAWQKEVTQNEEVQSPQSAQDIFADRIYVFTPTGDIVDLPKDATPLDFAYHIHSEVGHRCRGAKVNGHIVPLTQHLQTGERIEIMTAKEANPSRDWLNPHLGFIKSPRARAKISHWFRVRDSLQNAIDGREILEKEFKKLGINEKIDLNSFAEKFNYKTEEDLLAGIGSGDVRIAQITNLIQRAKPSAPPSIPEARLNEQKTATGVKILGINNLLTNIARCCKPLPGDMVIGYVTRARGVTIHRKDCANLKHATRFKTGRLMDVSWNEKHTVSHPVDIMIRAYDRAGLLRDITAVLATEKINVLGLHTQTLSNSPEADIDLVIEIANKQQLQKALDLLAKVTNVIDVKRKK